jgi:hypothetical protein
MVKQIKIFIRRSKIESEEKEEFRKSKKGFLLLLAFLSLQCSVWLKFDICICVSFVEEKKKIVFRNSLPLLSSSHFNHEKLQLYFPYPSLYYSLILLPWGYVLSDMTRVKSLVTISPFTKYACVSLSNMAYRFTLHKWYFALLFANAYTPYSICTGTLSLVTSTYLYSVICIVNFTLNVSANNFFHSLLSLFKYSNKIALITKGYLTTKPR